MKFVHLLLLVTVRFACVAQGCDLTLRGQVNDEDNQEHLGFSVLKLFPVGITVQADDHGNFSFNGLCAGSYQIFVSHVGCKDTLIPIELKSSERIVIKLPHSLNALSDVEVLADHSEQLPAQPAYVLDRNDLFRSAGDNLARHLETAPGVRALSNGPTIAKPMVNGMQGYRVLILDNGVRLEGQQWGGEHAPEIDPYMAGHLMVMSGAKAVRYGSDAIGGVILVEPEDMPDTAAVTGEVNGSFETNGRLHSQSARLQGYLDRMKYFSWRVQGSRRDGGNVAAGGGDFLANTGLRENNFSYALDYHRKNAGISVHYRQFNAKNGIYEGAHFGNLTDLERVISSGTNLDSATRFSRGVETPYQSVSHELFKAAADVHTGPRSRFNFTYANQYNRRLEFDAHGGEREDEHGTGTGDHPAADYRLLTQSAEIGWEHDYIRSWRGSFGVQGSHQRNAGEGMILMPNHLTRSAGMFAIERFVRPHYEIEAGVRYDIRSQQAWFFKNDSLHDPLLDFENLSGSIGGVFRNEGLRATVNVANAWRAPAMNELYGDGLHHGLAAIERGNGNLRKEHGICFTAGAEARMNRVFINASAYRYWFGNFIYYWPNLEHELTVRGAFPVFSYTQSAATIQGADIRLEIELARSITLKLRGSWTKGITSDGLPLFSMPPARYDASFVFFIKGGRLRSVFFEPSVAATERQERFVPGADFADPPPGYLLLNADAGFRIPVRGHELVLSFSARNLLDAQYRDYLDRLRYYTHAAGRSIVIRAKIPFTIFDRKNL